MKRKFPTRCDRDHVRTRNESAPQLSAFFIATEWGRALDDLYPVSRSELSAQIFSPLGINDCCSGAPGHFFRLIAPASLSGFPAVAVKS